MTTPSRSIGIPGFLLCLLLAGCGKARLEGSQVVARVDGDDISVHQLELAISRAQGGNPAPIDRETMLDKLIDRQLAQRQALAQKLDRRPAVMLRLEEARRDVLAAAYAEEIATRHQPPDEQAVASFYAEHPALFAERKIYRLRELSVPREASALLELKARLERKENFEQTLAWLQRQPGNFGDQLVLRSAEQLPIELTEGLSRVGPGESITFSFARGLVVYQVLATQPAPLPWAAAQPLIREHLRKQHETLWLRQELQHLRDAASIERRPAA